MSGSIISNRETGVCIPCPGVQLHADLSIPANATGLIVCAHDGGSNRSSPRNQLVMREMHRRRFTTLSLDLLTPAETSDAAQAGSLRLDVELLAERLEAVIQWIRQAEELKRPDMGFLAANTISAAALVAGTRLSGIKAIVSHSGRTDLAAEVIDRVRIPTLLIIGELDHQTGVVNRRTFDSLKGPKDLTIVRSASRFFTEPGALEAVSRYGACWFETHLSGTPLVS